MTCEYNIKMIVIRQYAGCTISIGDSTFTLKGRQDLEIQVKRIRLLRGMSLRELAEASGVGEANISRIENGKQSPHPATVRKLAKALGVSVAELWGEEEPGVKPAA